VGGFGILAVRPLRVRLLVVLAAVLAVASPLESVTPAQAAVASKVSLNLSPSVAAPDESFVVSGAVSPAASGRTVWLQSHGSSWSTVLSVKTNSTGHFSGSVQAGVAGSNTSWRAVALPFARTGQALSPTRALSVVKAALSLSAPLLAETNLDFTISGTGYPAREGRMVMVQRLSGSSWTDVGSATQSSTGGYSVKTSMSTGGEFTYRAVTSSWHGAAAVTSAISVVSVQAPSFLLTESTAIASETVNATGKLPGASSRRILVQRKSGADWVTLVEDTTSSTGSFATSFSAPDVGSYEVRVLAPKVTVARKVRPEYVSAVKTLSVVEQSASMLMPTTLVQSETGTATVTFAPARVGRAVALQVMRSGVWTAMDTGEQSLTGTASLTFTAGTPGSYSYRAWTATANGAPAFTSPAVALEVTAAVTTPGPVTAVSATPTSTSIALTWTNPSEVSLSGVMIRRAVGATPPASATAGTLVIDLAKPAISFTDTAVSPGTQYSYALFAHNAAFAFATAGTVTTSTLGVPPSISGTVTDAAPGHHGLANVRVSVSSASTGASQSVTTVGDGSYTVTGMPAGTDYQVCFYPAGATGGSSDALGYLDQCYDNQPMSGTPTAVTVTVGETRTAVDAALAMAGAITGTVSDAGGTHHGLANASVSVSSPSNGNYYGYARTAADGSYTVSGMPAGTDYQVCFFATGATGGSTDALGYLDQCYDNQPTTGTPTPVAVVLGAPRVGVNAALAVAGAISGTVSDEGGTHNGLANVSVTAYSASTGGSANASTAADGTYTVSGMPAGTDYQVCFYASGATGGSSDATGYLNQCYDNQPITGTPTPVAVTLGAPRVGIDAALAGGGAISGTVSDAGGSQHGLVNVWVSVSSESTATSVSVWTAADGTYTVSGLAAGTDYTVCFTWAGATGGSSDALGYLDQCYDSQPRSGMPTPVTVILGVPRVAVDAALVGAGAISGTVSDAGGTQHGLANVWVEVSSPSNGSYGSAATAADGSYTVSGLAAGTDYEVKFYASGASGGTSDATGYSDQLYDNQPISGTPTLVTVTLGAARTGVDAALFGGGGISGTVSDAGGTQHGLGNVSVTASSGATGGSASAITAEDGSYTVSGLAAGTDYQVCFHASGAAGGSSDSLGYVDQCYDNQPTSGTPTPVAVTVGAPRVGIDAALAGGGAISGTVSEAAGTQHGLANVSVSVSSASTGGSANATTAADGTYTVTGLAAGTDYQVCFYASGAAGGSSDALGYFDQCYDSQPISGTPTPVAVTLGATSPGIVALLAAYGAISGTVSEAGGTRHGLASVSVSVYSASTGANGYATTAADGTYTVSGLAAGTDYMVCFSGAGAKGGSSDATGYLDQCYDNQPTSGTPTPVAVTLGATRGGIDAVLVGGGAISGTVRDGGGTQHGLVSVQVSVYSASRGAYGSAATAADGTYTVTGLAAGTDYQVCFYASAASGGSSDATGYLDQCYDKQLTSGTPTPVAVTLGATRGGIDAALGVLAAAMP